MSRILYVTRVPLTAARFVLPLARKLTERGNHVEFAFGPGEYLDAMLSSGFPVTLVPMQKNSFALSNFRAVTALYRLAKEGEFDAVHTYSPVAGVVGRIAAHFAGVPVVIHTVIGSLMVRGVPLLHQFLYLMSEWVLGRWVTLFITLNDTAAHDLVKYHLAPPEKVASLRYEFGVDLSEFNPDRIDKHAVEAVRYRFGLEQGIPVVGFVGRLIGTKGILDLFDAYATIRRNGYQVKLLYVGDVLTSDKDQHSIRELKRRVVGAGLQDDVVFAGFQKDVPLYMALMDIVVLPSHREGFPRIPVEAGAMGKPSVITATGGAEVAVEDGKTGFVVPIGDVNRLAEALESLIRDPMLAQRMGAAGLARARELFDQDKILEQQVDYYRTAFQNTSDAFQITV